MDDTATAYIGRRLTRREDRRLLTGQGQFIADLALPRMLHMTVVRSPLAHARIRAVDLTRARGMPGVVGALNGADLLQLLPPVPEGQIAMPRKWASVVQHQFLNRKNRCWRMTKPAMSARPWRWLSPRAARRPRTRPRRWLSISRNCRPWSTPRRRSAPAVRLSTTALAPI